LFAVEQTAQIKQLTNRHLVMQTVSIYFLYLLGEMNTSAQAHLRVELLNYGTLTQIPVVKSFCLFTSRHTTKPSKYFMIY